MEKAMKVRRYGLSLTMGACLLSLMVGCGQAPDEAVAAPAGTSATAPAAAEPLPAAVPESVASAPMTLTEGMAYADLRKAVLAKGWKPKVDAQCKVNVVGANFADVCKADPDQCKVCDEVPELSSCSGDGHCLMNFERSNAEALAVSTYGEIADWNVSGKSSRLTVKWFDPQSID